MKNMARGTGHLWQADHIMPVIEGGGECTLDNMRTLCTACHKAETAALVSRRAFEKRKPLIDQRDNERGLLAGL